MRLVARGEARFQPIAEGHEFIDFGDDAVLFGEMKYGVQCTVWGARLSTLSSA